MTTIGEVAKRIITLVVGVALDVHTKERRLQPLNHVIMNAQAAIYWLRLTTIEPDETDTIEVAGQPQQEIVVYPPTLFSVQEHLEYLDKELRGLIKDVSVLIASEFTPSTTYNLQRAYDKLHESLFNIELAINYYGQITERR